MATWTPDPSFYPSPRLAGKAPAEKHAYVAEFDPERKRPDRLAVVDVDPAVPDLRQDRRADEHAAVRVTSCTTSAGTPAAPAFARTPRTRTSSAAT